MSNGEPALHTWLAKEFAVAINDIHIAGKHSLSKKKQKMLEDCAARMHAIACSTSQLTCVKNRHVRRIQQKGAFAVGIRLARGRWAVARVAAMCLLLDLTSVALS
jgi:hypothetical protein